MINTIIAEVNIGDKKIPYSNITLTQKFNDHHQFTILVNHHVFEKSGTLSLENTKEYIGEYVVISLFTLKGTTLSRKWDFKGIICEVSVRSGIGSEGHLELKGFSPTILLEDGPG
jgi:type VI secretion system secreted protein VgrG